MIKYCEYCQKDITHLLKICKTRQFCNKKCSYNSRKGIPAHNRLDEEKILSKIKEIHGDKYCYKNFKYTGLDNRITLTCKKCKNVRNTTAKTLLNGHDCDKCIRPIYNKKKRKTLEQFIKESEEIHSKKYGYSKFKYILSSIKGKIYCKTCKKYFLMAPTQHIRAKQGCRTCGITFNANNQRKTIEKFIEQANKIHNHKYCYKQSIYPINRQLKIRIYCLKCQRYFLQSPANHLIGNGCKRCYRSKGEIQVENWLTIHNFKFETQYRFHDCRNIKPLPFDFYLPDLNTCIEFQGAQHYSITKWFGAAKCKIEQKRKYESLVKRDSIKKKYCKQNKINLILIKYNQNISKILKEKLGENNAY